MLIANPALFSNQQRYFNKSVILMVSHGGASEGSMGIILNKPTGHTVKEADGVSGYVHGYANHKCEDRPLHMGGDVGGCMLMLHSVDVPSAHKVRTLPRTDALRFSPLQRQACLHAPSDARLVMLLTTLCGCKRSKTKGTISAAHGAVRTRRTVAGAAGPVRGRPRRGGGASARRARRT